MIRRLGFHGCIQISTLPAQGPCMQWISGPSGPSSTRQQGPILKNSKHFRPGEGRSCQNDVDETWLGIHCHYGFRLHSIDNLIPQTSFWFPAGPVGPGWDSKRAVVKALLRIAAQVHGWTWSALSLYILGPRLPRRSQRNSTGYEKPLLPMGVACGAW